MDINTHFIFYNDDNNQPVMIFPSPFSNLTLEQIALKDVPKGKIFKYIPKSEVPEEIWIFQEAFVIDYSEPDGVGADHGRGSFNAVISWDDNGNPILEEKDHVQ